MDLFLGFKEKEKLYLREPGRPGKDGKSAYQIWLEQGNEGTEEDFLNSIKGKDGYTPQKGIDYFDGKDYIPTEADIEEIAGKAAEKVEIPAEYVTETELGAKGYQTKTEADGTYQPKGSYATTEQLAQAEAKIPTKTSQLNNDSNLAYKSDIPTKLPASDVYEWAKQPSKPTYSKSDVGLGNVDNVKQYSANNPPPYPVTSVNGQGGDVEVEPNGTAETKVINHNADEKAHSYILLLIEGLTARFNAFMDSDDTTLDQASEMIAYIKANRELIESITTAKVNVTDIIDNLTTSVSNKPLSAKQGVQLKALIDAIKVPTALSQLTGDSTHRTVTDSEKAAWNAKSDFSGKYADLEGKPTIPTVPTNVSAFNNDAGYQKTSEADAKYQPKGTYITQSDLEAATNSALEQAKASGEFDGVDGQRGFSLLKVTTAPSSYTTATGGFTPTYRIALSTVKTQSKATEVIVGDTLAYSYYQYPIGYVDGSYVYLGTRVSIRGAAYTLTDSDKEAITAAVKASLTKETWTFTLEDGNTVTKEVYVG